LLLNEVWPQDRHLKFKLQRRWAIVDDTLGTKQALLTARNMNIHPLSDVQTERIGEGTTVWQYVVILRAAVIGKDCNISAFCFIENDVLVGDRVTVKSGVHLWDGLTLEDDVFLGPNVTFTNDKYPRSKHYPEHFQRTTIRRGASVGANATILGGVTVGEQAMIGAGSVVTRDVPARETWFGNPARKSSASQP
jgi:UDP-2-acetamido-3-amino-2,3-dideoxy-glucuronate N-acetyltransferase